MMSPTPPPPNDGLVMRLLESAGSAIFGAIVALVTFRTRLSKIEGRLKIHDGKFPEMDNHHTVELMRLRAEIAARHEENKVVQRLAERRQMFTLKLVADVARKLEVDKRVDDIVIEFLTADAEE